MTTIATVCARGGSRGVPGKNIRPLLGRPLIEYTVLQALDTPEIDGVYVSTDDREIADIAQSVGATVLSLRPPQLATDHAPKIPVIQHLVSEVQATGVDVTRIVDLQPTSPLRLTSDISEAMALLTPEFDVVITGSPSAANPYFSMVEEKSPGLVGLVATPTSGVSGRQQAPRVFDMNGSIYVWWPQSLQAGLWGGRTTIHEMPRSRSIDVDDEIDWMILEVVAARTGVLDPYTRK